MASLRRAARHGDALARFELARREHRPLVLPRDPGNAVGALVAELGILAARDWAAQLHRALEVPR